MDYDTYILIDYENAQGINIDIIDEKVKIVIVIGGNKNKISVDLIQAAFAEGVLKRRVFFTGKAQRPGKTPG
jgi:hypothetical protein